MIFLCLLLLLHCMNSNAAGVCSSIKSVNGFNEYSCAGYDSFPQNIQDPAKVQSLDLSDKGNVLLNIKNYSLKESGLTFLKLLNLKNCTVKTIEKFALAGKNNIQVIDLSFNVIETLDPRVFTGLDSLQRLIIRNNPIKSFAVGASFPNLRKLEFLDLSSCSISDLPDYAFYYLSNLEVLYLNNNKLRTISWQTFENNDHLLMLKLHENPWNCDCNIRFFMDYMQKNHSKMSPTYYQQAVCSDVHSANNAWAAVTSEAMFCPPVVSPIEYTYMERYPMRKIIYMKCTYYGHPQPNIAWTKDARPLFSMGQNTTNFLNRRVDDYTYHDVTQFLSFAQKLYNYKYVSMLTIENVTELDNGVYTCTADETEGHHFVITEPIYIKMSEVSKPHKNHHNHDSDCNESRIGFDITVVSLLSVCFIMITIITYRFIKEERSHRHNSIAYNGVIFHQSQASSNNINTSNPINPALEQPEEKEVSTDVPTAAHSSF